MTQHTTLFFNIRILSVCDNEKCNYTSLKHDMVKRMNTFHMIRFVNGDRQSNCQHNSVHFNTTHINDNPQTRILSSTTRTSQHMLQYFNSSQNKLTFNIHRISSSESNKSIWDFQRRQRNPIMFRLWTI